MSVVQQLPRPSGTGRGPGPASVPVPRRIANRDADEWIALAGSALGSLALVWVLYENLLALSGLLGFIVCWYVTFLGTYAGVTAVSHPLTVVKDRIASSLFLSAAVIVGGALATTVVYTFVRGAAALVHVNFYTQDMAGVGPTAPLTQGGVLMAIAGTLIEIGIAIAISLPLGVATAVYMTEVRGRLSKVVRTVVEAMTALPEILAGLFVYVVLIVRLGYPRTGFAAAVAISVTMIPIIARSSEVALRVVPGGLREASLALGSSHWQTVRRVVLPTAKAGLATALILGVARGIGETAAVLITSGASSYLNLNPFQDPMNSLPLFAFNAVRSGQDLYITRGFGAAAILLVLVLTLFVIMRLLARGQVRSR
jgi:phosphate transport system permease protein